MTLEFITSDLIVKYGAIEIPTGSGCGIELEPDFIKKHKSVTLVHLKTIRNISSIIPVLFFLFGFYENDPNSEHIENEEMALNIDIAPIILSYAGIKIPEKIQGEDLKPLIKGEKVNIRKAFLCEHLFDHPKIAKSEGVRTDKFKYFRYIDFPNYEELYDLTNDPNESRNLIHENDYKEVVKELKGKLLNMKKMLTK